MTNPLCVIVGAGDGLGQSLARIFAKNGFAIALLSRTEQGSREALNAAGAAAPGGVARYYAADATRPESLELALAQATRDLGDVELLIYNVRGAPSWKPPLAMTYAELREIHELEVVGAFAAAKAVIPDMIARQRGTVIYSSATAAFRGSASNPLYAIGKFGLRALAQSLAKAYAKDGVHIAHIRLDCTLDVPLVRREYGAKFKPEEAANTDDVAQTYLWVHQQPKSAWSNEVELRPSTETWTC